MIINSKCVMVAQIWRKKNSSLIEMQKPYKNIKTVHSYLRTVKILLTKMLMKNNFSSSITTTDSSSIYFRLKPLNVELLQYTTDQRRLPP